MTMSERMILERLRRISLALPEAIETTSFGHPTFKAKDKTFAVLETYRGELSICFKMEPSEQQHRAETTACRAGRPRRARRTRRSRGAARRRRRPPAGRRGQGLRLRCTLTRPPRPSRG